VIHFRSPRTEGSARGGGGGRTRAKRKTKTMHDIEKRFTLRAEEEGGKKKKRRRQNGERLPLTLPPPAPPLNSVRR
jgi:hypothetical protein